MKPFRYSMAMTLLVALTASGYPRSDMPSLSFEYKDWELVCDNTRACRAAGYHQEDDGPNASILLTRAAGPNQAVQVELQLADDESHPPPATVAMSIDGRALGVVKLDKDGQIGSLSASQVAALLPALLADHQVAWTSGKTGWTVSSAGANAVLLKMDDFQGRLGTPGALVRKGTNAEGTVLPALPQPRIVAARVAGTTALAQPFNAAARQTLIAALRKRSNNDCPLFDSKEADDDRLDVWQLDKGKLLVAHPCWRGAYNEGDGYWVVTDRAPYDPILVTTAGSDYQDGVITSAQKGRGIGDCMQTASWTWDGRTFSQTAAATTGMCRQIAAGGAWNLPTIVTHVDKAR